MIGVIIALHYNMSDHAHIEGKQMESFDLLPSKNESHYSACFIERLHAVVC